MSDRVKVVRMATGNDLVASFLIEAKRHLDDELNKSCLTTIQGVYLLSVYCCCEGNSRAGSMYRFATLQMLRGMKSGTLYRTPGIGIPAELKRRRALSRLCWGIFIFEL